MASFVAVAPPDGDVEKTAFVRDGFAFWAFLLPVLWFLFHRMWIEAALALGATLLLGSLDLGGDAAGPLLSLLFGVIVGLEAPTLRLWALRRRGWREAGVIEAHAQADAETRFFLDAEEGASDRQSSPPAPFPTQPMVGPRRAPTPALGFLDHKSIA